MDRRSFCKTAGALGVVAGTAGCLGVLGDPGAEGAILGPQIKISARHRSRATATRCPSSPSPIRSATRRSRQHSSRASARCCGPLFTRTVRTGSVPPSFSGSVAGRKPPPRRGYGDQVAFLPTTFDPERDTAETLREYAGQQGRRPRRGELALPPPGDLRAGPRDTRRALRSEDREDTGRRYREPGVPLPARAHHSRQQARDHRACVPTGTKDRHRSNGSSTTSNESRPRESPWGLVGRLCFPQRTRIGDLLSIDYLRASTSVSVPFRPRAADSAGTSGGEYERRAPSVRARRARTPVRRRRRRVSGGRDVGV